MQLRLSKCKKKNEHNFKPKNYPKEMQETTSKYRLWVLFSTAKLTFHSFSTIYYSNVFTFPQTYFHLLKFTDKFIQKCQKLKNVHKTSKIDMSAARNTLDIYNVWCKFRTIGQHQLFLKVVRPGICFAPKRLGPCCALGPGYAVGAFPCVSINPVF